MNAYAFSAYHSLKRGHPAAVSLAIDRSDFREVMRIAHAAITVAVGNFGDPFDWTLHELYSERFYFRSVPLFDDLVGEGPTDNIDFFPIPYLPVVAPEHDLGEDFSRDSVLFEESAHISVCSSDSELFAESEFSDEAEVFVTDF